MLHKILDGITGIAICMVLLFASGIDSPDPAGTKICAIGILACGAWIAIYDRIREAYYFGEEDE